MTNRTDSMALDIHGTDPQFLVDKILRNKIYDTPYWKTHCFGLNSQTLIDEVIHINAMGGTYGAIQAPSKFVCLLLKVLQIQPSRDIVMEYLLNEDFKYVRLLAALYIRLTYKPIDIYTLLEPLYNDYRKVRYHHSDGSYSILHVDEVIEQLLNDSVVCSITLPFLPKRRLLEESGRLEPRQSALEELLDDEAGGDANDGKEPTSGASVYSDEDEANNGHDRYSDGAADEACNNAHKRQRSPSPSDSDDDIFGDSDRRDKYGERHADDERKQRSRHD